MKTGWFLVLMLLFGNMFFMGVSGDTQVWENQYGRLEVWPMTATGFGKFTQYANLTWYYPDNTVDVAFRFDKPLRDGKIWHKSGDSWNRVSMDSISYKNKQYYVYSNFNIKQDKTYNLKWTYTPQSLEGKWDLIVKLSSDTIQQALSSGRYIFLDPWWNSNWAGRVKIWINHSYFETPLKNFPIRVNTTSNEVLSACQADGRDIRFVGNDDSTEYPYEIEQFTSNGMDCWVNVTDQISNTTNTTMWMYYGNAGAADNQSTKVWDDNYSAVLHMDDASGFLNDSTVNGTNFKEGGVPVGYHAGGKVGYAVDGDATDDYFRNTTLNVTGYNQMTVEVWYNPVAFSNGHKDYLFKSLHHMNFGTHEDVRFAFLHGSGGADSGYMAYWDDQTTAEGGSDASYNFEDGFKYYVTVCDNDSFVYGYRNTSRTISDVVVDFDFTGMQNEHDIGRRSAASDFFTGIIDEVRISNIARNWSWLNATFHSINASDFLEWGSSEANIHPPNALNVSTIDINTINLTFWKNSTATHTVVERNTVSGWGRGAGTEVYNDTGSWYSDTAVSSYTEYFYRAWSYNSGSNVYSASSVLGSNITGPGNPSNIATDYDPGSYLNITWSFHSWGDTVLVRQKANSYPTGPADGSFCYNGSLSYYNHTSPNATDKFTLWSYNSSVNLFSSGVDVSFGGLQINVFNESDGSAIGNWDVTISNSDGSESYTNTNCSNTHSINVDDCPLGDDILIIISEGNYSLRTYYLDLATGTHYVLNAYLPYNSDTELYYIQVIDNYSFPVENAVVDVKRYVNDSYKVVSNLRTDSYGFANIFLVPTVDHKFLISKTNYHNKTSNWLPDPIYYGASYPKVFKIIFITEGIDNLWDNITWNIDPSGQDHFDNFTFFFNISSSNSQLVSYSGMVYIWNSTNSLWELLYSDSGSNAAGGSISYTTVNGTGRYAFVCSFQKTGFSVYNFGVPYSSEKYVFNIWPFIINGSATSLIDSTITGLVGISPVSIGTTIVAYSSLIASVAVMFIFFTFSAKFSGLGIIIVGIVLGAFKQPLGIIGDAAITNLAVAGVIFLGVLTLYAGYKGVLGK